MTEAKTAFHAVWTAVNRHTNQIVIDHTLASGPVSTRELAQRICEVERVRRERQEAQRGEASVLRHTFEVITRPLEMGTSWATPAFWDDSYDDAWLKARRDQD